MSAASLSLDRDHVLLPPAISDGLPAVLEVEVHGIGVIEAARDGEILAGANLGQLVQQAGGLLQIEATGRRLHFRNALTLGDSPRLAPVPTQSGTTPTAATAVILSSWALSERVHTESSPLR